MTSRKFFWVLYAAFFILLIALGLMSSMLNLKQEDVKRRQENRFQSYLLANYIRQSVDDLTRLVRSYVITGDLRYELQYQNVLAIREGKKARPDGQSASLMDLMKKAGFTTEELNEMDEVNSKTESLLKIEEKAFLSMKGKYADSAGKLKEGKPDQAMAIRLVHDDIYQIEKAKTMAPLDDFIAMKNFRTKSMLEETTKRGKLYLNISIALLAVLSAIVVVSLIAFHRKGNKPIQGLQDATHHVAMDLSQLTQVATGLANGDLAQTAQIQTQPLEINTKDELGNLAREFNQIIGHLRETVDSHTRVGETVKFLMADVNILAKAAGEGKLSTRGDVSRHQGNFRKIIQNINHTLDALTGPLRLIVDHIKRLSGGELPPKITTSFNGDFTEMINAHLNQFLDNAHRINQNIQQIANGDLNIVVAQISGNDMWSDKLGQMVNNLRELVRQMQEATDNISRANNNISAATAEQAASVSEQAASVAETSSTVEEGRQTAQ